MPKVDDRLARVLARTQEVNIEEEDTQTQKSSVRSRRSERIIINDQEMDIDRVVQKVRERLSSPGITSPKPPSVTSKPDVPSPRSIIEERRSSPRETYVEKPSPRSPAIRDRLPVTEVREIALTRDIVPESPERRISPALSYDTLKKSTREEVVDSLRGLNSQQLRDEILKLRSERSIKKTSIVSKVSVREDDKIPVYDRETGTWVLYPKSQLPIFQTPVREEYNSPYPNTQGQKIQPPLFRRGTTRDAYPTKTHTYDPDAQYRTQQYPDVDVAAINPQQVEENTDIDFDIMDDVQKREFLDEMKMKFAVLKKNYPEFPIPIIHDDDNPKWVFGIYEQLLDMAKGDASQPIYQTGLQVVFLILQVVLSMSGIPAKDFFTFHARHFSQYNKLMVELGEKWGPIIDVTSSTETKLALAIGWNTVIFAIVSVVASKYGDKWGTSVEQILNKITTSTTTASNQKMEDLKRQMDGREEYVPPQDQEPAAAPGGDMMSGLANMLGGLLGGGGGSGGNGGGGLGNLLGGLLGGMTGGPSATTTERKPPTYDD
jgi:hypothetical protein